jgi:RimJ/RimL family protein N-acetyltransferase
MIVTAHSQEDFRLFFDFMWARGVNIRASTDLQFLGHVGSDGELIGAVAFNAFDGRTCAIHVAGSNNFWINREFLKATFEYPFNDCDLVEIYGPVPGNNYKAIRLNKHLGFDTLRRVRHGWDKDTDLIIMVMNKSQCRWLNIKEKRGGQRQFITSSS